MEKKELIVKGKTKVCGIEVPIIYGGFGEKQKVILAKTVSEIHDRPLRKVNELIKKHIEEEFFEEGIDFIDIKNSILTEDSVYKEMGFTKQSISNAKNIYLLSQQGYTLLLSLLDTDLARKQYKQVIREYFFIKEAIKLNKDDLDRIVSREIGIIRRNKETETISKLISNGDFKGQKYNSYAIVTNTTYDVLYGMYKKDIVKFLDLKQQDNLRDFLSKKDLDEIKEIEDFVHFLGKMGKNWKEIYVELFKAYPNKIVPQREDMSIKQLKKCKNTLYLTENN